MRSRVSGEMLTFGVLFKTNETVVRETPARSATCFIVMRCRTLNPISERIDWKINPR
jgi:hypothetical protein